MSNPTELPDLLPCPFCGNDEVHVQDSYLQGSGFMVMCGNCTGEGPLCETEQNAAAQWNRRAKPEGEAPQAEPEPMNTQSSREYLIEFMEKHFTDKTYHRYIRGEATRNGLAGEFAWQMARALRMLERAPAATLSPLCSAQPAESGKEAAQLSIGFANNDQGVHVSVMQQHAGGAVTLLHQAKVPAGDSFARVTVAAQQAAAPGALPGRIISATPGMSIIEVKIDNGFLPQWLDPGYQVHVSSTAPSAPGTPEAPADIDYSIKKGDTVYTKTWRLTPLEVVDVNWALSAIAVRLGPDGGVVVWPAAGMSKTPYDQRAAQLDGGQGDGK
jgi:Lar family restriction alleviation protein